MNTQSRRAPLTKRKLPFLTNEELNQQIPAVIIRVFGSCTVRGEHRKDVYAEDYAADIIVPAKYNLGHIKLQVNRWIKNPKNIKNGIRCRTWQVDAEVPVKAATEKKYFVKDFMSDMSLQENKRAKEQYDEKIRQIRERRAREEDPDYQPEEVTGAIDSTEYGADGLPPLRIEGADDIDLPHEAAGSD